MVVGAGASGWRVGTWGRDLGTRGGQLQVPWVTLVQCAGFPTSVQCNQGLRLGSWGSASISKGCVSMPGTASDSLGVCHCPKGVCAIVPKVRARVPHETQVCVPGSQGCITVPRCCAHGHSDRASTHRAAPPRCGLCSIPTSAPAPRARPPGDVLREAAGPQD